MNEYLDVFMRATKDILKVASIILLIVTIVMAIVLSVNRLKSALESTSPECRIDPEVTFELHKTAGRPDGTSRYHLYKISREGFELIDYNIWTSGLEFGKEYRIIVVEPE